MVKSFIEFLAMRYTNERFVDRLTKDIVLSAARKAKRDGRFWAAIRIFKTSVYGLLTSYLAQYVVEIGFIVGWELQQKGTWREHLSRIFHQMHKKAHVYVPTLFGTAAGAMLGTLIYPGSGTKWIALIVETGTVIYFSQG
jgi:hypothetical protein